MARRDGGEEREGWRERKIRFEVDPTVVIVYTNLKVRRLSSTEKYRKSGTRHVVAVKRKEGRDGEIAAPGPRST